MPDTEQNQAEYPQPSSQAEGLGFPILRAVALTSLATGILVALAMGRYAGKETGETALFRTLFDKLRRGDFVLADRYYGGWRCCASWVSSSSLGCINCARPTSIAGSGWGKGITS